MPQLNLWITSTFGRKFEHEYITDEEESLENHENPGDILEKTERIINDINGIYKKIVKFSAELEYTDNLGEVTFSLNIMPNHLPRDIFERIETFFHFVAVKYPASYGTCYMFGDEPPLEMEIIVIKMIGKEILRERDPFFLKYLPKYVEPEE